MRYLIYIVALLSCLICCEPTPVTVSESGEQNVTLGMRMGSEIAEDSAGMFSIGVFSAGLFSIGIFSIGIFSLGLWGVGIFVYAKNKHHIHCNADYAEGHILRSGH